MTRQRVAVGTVEDGMVKVRYIPCRRHSSAGLTARADGADLLCATCRRQVAEEVRKAGRYNGSKPLADEPVPANATTNAKRMTDRQERKQAFAKALKNALKTLPWAYAAQEAGRKVHIAPKTARDYGRELREEDPAYWAKAEAARS